jgi:hypothetical protein
VSIARSNPYPAGHPLQRRLFASASNYTFDLDPSTWGSIHLLIGVLLILSGLSLFSGAAWAGVVAMTLAVLSAVSNFFFIPYYPFWSIMIIAMDTFVIWALAAHGKDVEYW